MSAPRILRTALVLALLAMMACDEPSRVVAPQPVDPPLQGPAKEGDLDFSVSTWPRAVIADFETELEAVPVSRDRIVSLEWRFNDGTLARGSKIRHTFDREGVTAVLVRATTETGQVIQRQVTLKVSPGIAALASTLVGIVPGGVHTCAIDGASTLHCWGWNGNGNLGNGSTSNSSVPVAIAAGLGFAQVATGFAHSCALTTSGVAYCWGRNYSGQLGDGTKVDRSQPTPVSTSLTFASIDVGYDHSCAVTDAGVAYCWGSDQFGQIGDGSSLAERLTPTATGAMPALNYVRAGYHHTCGLTTTGVAYCWGRNNLGQIGNATGGVTASDLIPLPTLVTAPGVFTDLDAGAGHTCGIVGQRVYCWGWNAAGQLGSTSATVCLGSRPCIKVPTRISGGRKYSAVSAGASHTCGIDPGGVAYCWGANVAGELGDGTTIQRPDDTRAVSTVQFKSIRAGGGFTCGISLANTAYCWGSNSMGKLGLGDVVDRHTPTLIPGLTF